MRLGFKTKSILQEVKYLPSIVKLMWNFDRKHLILSGILSLILGGIPSISLLLSQQMINTIVARRELKIVFAYLLFYVLVSLLSEYCRNFKNYNETYLQNTINYELNCLVMKKCQKLSLADFENSVIYDKLQRIQGEISYKPYQTLQILTGLLTIFSMLLSSITILVLWKPYCAIFLLIIPLFSSFYYIKLGKTEFDYKLKRTEEGRKSWYLSKLLTTDSSIKEVKLFDLSKYLITKYKKINRSFIEQDMEYMKKRSVYDLLYETILHICSCVVVVLSVLAAYNGQILIGNVVTYIRSISNVESGCASLLNSIYLLYNNTLYIRELFEFIELKECSEEDNNKYIPLSSIQDISLKNVSFVYKNGNVALKNINLYMKKGEKIAIVGQNGSGKTTLIKLLSCLYHSYEGEILINNTNIKEYGASTIRKNISVLFQDYVKYEMTLRDNVGFGDVIYRKEDGRIHKVLQKVGLDNIFPGGLSTQLGLWFNEGIGLSGGQWQKLAISRMMFKRCSVYILDEPNAALDPISVNNILKNFFEYVQDSLCIFITHKMSSVQYADRIIVMKDGEIIGDGTHSKLYKENEYYKMLYDKEMN